MNAQHQSRLIQIKEYVTTLSDIINLNDHPQALSMMSKFKKVVLKQDVNQHLNQFTLDCLRAKNSKLKEELQQLQQQKQALQIRVSDAGPKTRSMKEVKVGMFMSRLTVSLSQIRKVDYEQVRLTSDYRTLEVSSVIEVDSIQIVQSKSSYVYLSFQQQQTQHVLLKFINEREAQRWSVCVKFGMLISSTKNKQKLFENKTVEQPQQRSPKNYLSVNQAENNQSNSSTSRNNTMIQVPFMSFRSSTKNLSAHESMIMHDKFAERSADRSLQKKNTERSLVNAMTPEAAVKTSVTRRMDIARPPNLSRVRGFSQSIDNAFQISKIYKSSGNRKQSEDIFKPHINQTYHEKMLEKYRENNEENIRSQESFRQEKLKLPQPPDLKMTAGFSNPVEREKSSRIKALEDRKKELIKQSLSTAEKPTFGFESRISWAGIEEMEDENKSKSSNIVSIKGSEFSQSGFKQSQNQKESHEQRRSQHISEKSQEDSPRMPVKVSYDVPQKVSYTNGIVFRLNPVQKGSSSPAIASQGQSDQKKGFEKTQKSKSFSSSDLQSDQNLDPSSHENHTQSQDNTARAQQLKKGIILTKCSENGFWPHEKILYLSQSEMEVCSRDLKDKKIKKIKLVNIQSVDYCQFDKGIIKHISDIKETNCLVIRALAEDNKIKNFEFVGNLAEPLERFANNLKLFVEYAKKY